MFEAIVFYVFGAILLAAALCVITARNPVHAALFLVLAFFTASAIWLLLRAEFLAITLVLVYVGAVMVLFLFVVMMLDINLERLREGFWQYLPLGALVGVLMAFEMGTVVPRITATRASSAASSTPTMCSPSRSPRWCCWWRSSRPSRSRCAGARTRAARIPRSRCARTPRGACAW